MEIKSEYFFESNSTLYSISKMQSLVTIHLNENLKKSDELSLIVKLS